MSLSCYRSHLSQKSYFIRVDGELSGRRFIHGVIVVKAHCSDGTDPPGELICASAFCPVLKNWLDAANVSWVCLLLCCSLDGHFVGVDHHRRIHIISIADVHCAEPSGTFLSCTDRAGWESVRI